MTEIQKLPKTRWKEYRELRLHALQTEPQAFGRSYEEEVNASQEEWERKIEDLLFATEDNNIVGMIAIKSNTMYKKKHIAELTSFYVKKEHRNKGVGSQLIDHALQEIKKSSEIEKVRVITDPNLSAVTIYKKHGFKKIADLPNELKYNGEYFDDIIMDKDVKIQS